MKEIVLHDGITSIGNQAFEGCVALKNIAIPAAVTSIGDCAFDFCSSLESIFVNAENESYCSFDGILYNKPATVMIHIPQKISGEITIPDGVTSIGNYAFEACVAMTDITIPASVTSIGDDVFYMCNSLASISVDAENEQYCSIDGILYNKPTTAIIHVPYGISGEITIPDGVTNIGDWTFANCEWMTKITIPESVTGIGNHAFYNCTLLASITLPTKLESIGSSAFMDCDSLTCIVIPDSVTSLGNSAFFGCDLLTSVTLGEGITSIADDLFSTCSKLKNVILPDYLTSVEAQAFYYCTSLESVTLPAGVTRIGNYAFFRCDSLTSFAMPNSVTSIGQNAFGFCSSLQTIVFCGTETQWNSVEKEAYWNFQNVPVSLHDYQSTAEDNTSHKTVCAVCETVKGVFDHVWNSGVITTEATHTTMGVKTFTCTDCGKTKTETVAKLADHVWGDGVITTRPTHTTTGVETYTCPCGATKTEVVPVIATHSYGAWQKHNAELHKRVCECEHVDYADHSWNAGVITTAATHTTTGIKTYTCTKCGETKTHSVPMTTTHNYGTWQKYNTIMHKRTCECHIVDYAEHSWNSGMLAAQPTHTTTGVKTYTCTECGEIDTETVPVTEAHSYGAWQKHNADQHKRVCECEHEDYADHSWNGGVTTTRPTHTATGVKTYTCTDCGETKTEVIPVTEAHSYGAWQKYNTEQHKRACACEALGYANHEWNDGVITTEATHTTLGVRTYTCTDCGETKTEAIPRTTSHSYDAYRKHNDKRHEEICACGYVRYDVHTWDEGVITKQPTYNQGGQRAVTCTDCGEIKIESIPALDPADTTAPPSETTTPNDPDNGKDQDKDNKDKDNGKDKGNNSDKTQHDSADTTDPTDMIAPSDVQDALDGAVPQLGCGASLSVSWSVLVLVALLPVAFLRKKKENE